MKIIVYGTATESDFYCDMESTYSYNVKISEFDIEIANEFSISDLKKFIKDLNSKNSTIMYGCEGCMGDIYTSNSEERAYLNSESFLGGAEDFSKSLKDESERLEKNREIRKELKELKSKKELMSRSEVISSGIVKKIDNLRKSIR